LGVQESAVWSSGHVWNINYFTNPSENEKNRIAKGYSEASESLCQTDSAVGDEDDGPKLGGRGNLSVKDAISIFEVKQRVLWIQPRQGYQSKGAAGIPLTMGCINSRIYYVIWFIWVDNNMCKYRYGGA
jgi:hypothetical protein